MIRSILAVLAAGVCAVAAAAQPMIYSTMNIDGRIGVLEATGQDGAPLYALGRGAAAPAADMPESFVLRAGADGRAICFARPDYPDWGCFSECAGGGGLLNAYSTARAECRLEGRCSADADGGMSCRTLRPVGAD